MHGLRTSIYTYIKIIWNISPHRYPRISLFDNAEKRATIRHRFIHTMHRYVGQWYRKEYLHWPIFDIICVSISIDNYYSALLCTFCLNEQQSVWMFIILWLCERNKNLDAFNKCIVEWKFFTAVHCSTQPRGHTHTSITQLEMWNTESVDIFGNQSQAVSEIS